MIGAMIIRAVYGLDVYGADEKYVPIAEKSMKAFSTVFDPGRYLVHPLPWLRFVPAWFPGAKFQREFAEWKPQVAAARDLPWEAAAEKVGRLHLQFLYHNLTNGAAPSCLKKRLGNAPAVSLFATQMERIANGQEDEMTAMRAAGSAYLGELTICAIT